MGYLTQFNTRKTPQTEPIPGSVSNNAGGYSFAVDDWTRLRRFLVLGASGGTYYVKERTLVIANAEAVLRCIAADGPRTVQTIVDLSVAGQAPKNDPALFALALCAAHGDAITKRAALAALPQVARIGTHLFHFAQYVQSMRGWGRGLRRAVAAWYTTQDAPDLAYQALKYRERDGWGHRDLLRLAHPIAPTAQHTALFHWITKGWEDVGETPHPDVALRQVWAFERLQRTTTAPEAAALITAYRLPREAVPTPLLTEPAVWMALLADMPMTALTRNLATLTRLGVLAPMSEATVRVCAQLTDVERLRRARVHPLALLSALKTYAQGHGERSTQTWTPVQAIMDALDSAFYLAFQTVVPTNKRWMLALDVSGSMGSPVIAGVPGITPRVATAALALVTAATEPQHAIMAFSHEFVPFNISPRQRLGDVLKLTDALPFGGTDCALPMLTALRDRLPVDVFVVLTDSETWAGRVHPVQALQQYRQQMGIAAKLIVVGMTATEFSIADPADAGMLDVVGFDTATPTIMADFATA